MGDRFFGLALVGGAHIKNLRSHRLMQHHGAGGRANQGHAMLLQNRNDALGMRCSAAHEQGDHAAHFYQFACVGGSQLGVELVVQRQDFNLFAMHATLGIDCIDVEHCACA